MHYVIKLHPEITIKSKSVRQRFTRLLEGNIRNVMRRDNLEVRIKRLWDALVVRPVDVAPERLPALEAGLQRIPGVNQIHKVTTSAFTDMDDIYQQTRATWEERIKGKTFAVRVKRKGKHDFSSTEVARYVGGGLNQHCDSAGVRLKNPEVQVEIEINNDQLTQVSERLPGLGGMPLPTQEDVLSLISGGFDSGVASYELIRRGARTHFVFFNLGGREHEIGVREVSHYLWSRYSGSHRVKFVPVDFEPVVAEILEHVDNGLMGVVLKRMMMRAASLVADNLNIKALVTGECLGQVSSQTLSNLQVIDQVTDKLIIRPLICADKLEIVNKAREIGTEYLAKSMPEYCGVISNRPTVAAKPDKVAIEEAKLAADLIERVVKAAPTLDIRTVTDEIEQQVGEVVELSVMPEDGVLVDIRSNDEEEANPIELTGIEQLHIPFYRLASKFPELDPGRQYYLYCDQGVMSHMQALLLLEKGHKNVGVYRP